MERLLCREHTGATIVEGCQLQSIFIGFCATVDEEQGIVFVPGNLAQTLSNLLLQTVDDRVGIESQRVQLLGHHLHVVRMAVANGNHGMATIQIQVLRTLIVPYVAPFSLDDVNVE